MSNPNDGGGDAEILTPEQARQLRTHQLARLVLGTFVFTFVIARILVIFIMDNKLPPQLFFHVKGTHVHHLNYGIFLLSFTGGWMLFGRPTGKWQDLCAVMYGLGLALTFDEFGMWLHLGGGYWQRASYDACVTVAGLLGLIAYGSQLRRWRPKHYATAAALLVVLIAFGFAIHRSMTWAGDKIEPKLYQLEATGPS